MNRTTLTSTLLIAGILLWNGVVSGQSMPALIDAEQQAMSDTLQYALENNKTNQAANWNNPATTRTGTVVPVRTFVDLQGRPCREFISIVTVNGVQQQDRGTACRLPNSTWYVVSDGPPVRVPVVIKQPAYVYHPLERYYVPPYTYYNPFHINFSFSYLFPGGSIRFGNYYPSGSGNLRFGIPYPGSKRWYPRTHRQPQKYRHYRPLRHPSYHRLHRRR